MKTILLIALSLTIAALFTIAPAWSQDDMTVVGNTDFPNPQRPPSVFEHDLHNETAGIGDCAVCHHVYEDGKRVEGESSEDQRCSECHDLNGTDSQPSLMQAFHRNCKGCHEEQEKGPILCGECHQR